MKTKLLHMRIPEKMVSDMEFVMTEYGYNSLQELARESLRSFVEKKRDEKLNEKIIALAGSQRGRGKHISKEEMNKYLLKTFFKEK